MYIRANLLPPSKQIIDLALAVIDREFDSVKLCSRGLCNAWIRDEELERVCNEFYGNMTGEQFIVQAFQCKNVMADGSLARLRPHIDAKRDSAFIYYIDLGGDNTKTSFYEIIDNQSKYVRSNWVDDADLHELSVFDNSLEQWYAIDTHTPHAVHNIIDSRKGITMHLSSDSFLQFGAFCEKFSNLLVR